MHDDTSVLDAEHLPPIVTARQAAEFLQVSLRTIRRMQSLGTLKAVRLPGVASVRYRRSDLIELVEGENA